jgi:hypothetical protein
VARWGAARWRARGADGERRHGGGGGGGHAAVAAAAHEPAAPGDQAADGAQFGRAGGVFLILLGAQVCGAAGLATAGGERGPGGEQAGERGEAGGAGGACGLAQQFGEDLAEQGQNQGFQRLMEARGCGPRRRRLGARAGAGAGLGGGVLCHG